MSFLNVNKTGNLTFLNEDFKQMNDLLCHQVNTFLISKQTLILRLNTEEWCRTKNPLLTSGSFVVLEEKEIIKDGDI
ncbi:hypothetical protein NECAME_18703 [Necator americanus]|uniref:Uncharacterized protein n=1 Tax=Necator americanus TaxID=51031 RepID=W2SVH1_NECAM|nr:hypothetical protein NECAME_18703 [Necator americanus]ETN72707.1 hypothetical protein NECAME_18703 [Necator americanus]